MRRTTTLLIILLNTICALADDGIRLNSRRIAVEDGLPGNTVNAIVQDDEGYIWMATNNGLTRYDGYSAVNYTELSTDGGHHLEARIGRLFFAPSSHRLWLSTATYQNACYDLRQARFVDWTAAGRHYRQQNKLMLTTSGMVVYGMNTGATLSGSDDGRPWARDYGTANGTLPSDNVLTVVEDSARNIFLPTTRGIAVIRPEQPAGPQMLAFGAGKTVIAAATTGTATCFLTADGEACIADTACNIVLTATLPAAMKRPARVNVSFVWQDRWMLFTPDGTLSMNMSDGTFTRPADSQIVGGLDQGRCQGYRFVANHSGQLWLFPDEGRPVVLDLIPNARLSALKGRKFHIARTNDGRLFIATYGNGLFVFNPQTASLAHYHASQPNPVVFSDYLLCAITDRTGNVWVGSETTGAYCLSALSHDAAFCLLPQPQRRGGWDNTVSSVGEHDGTIVLGTRDGCLYTVDKTRTQPLTPAARRQAAITAHITDREGHVWESTWGDGLYRDGQPFRCVAKGTTIVTDFVADIVADRQGRLWMATWNSGVLLVDGNGTRQFLADDMNGSRINDLTTAPDGTLWVASNNGIARWNGHAFDVMNTTNRRFVHDEVNALLADGDHTLWVATAGGGVVCCSLSDNGTIARTEAFTTRQGLANNNVLSMVMDRSGALWVGTEDGLSRIGREQSIVTSYRFGETPQGNVMSARCALLHSDGRLLFGTADGLLTVNPEAVARQTRDMSCAGTLTDLHINGQSVYTLQLLEQTLSRSRQVCLSHRQNTLSLFFSNFDYDAHQQPVYQFYLEGLDHSWHDATTANHADYTELQPGRYVFHLRSLDAQGRWSGQTTLAIVIGQPWWNTWWAWLGYLLVAALLGWYVWSNWKEKFDLYQQMKLERQLNDFRVRFFTHIAHEFRTPLAIIKGAVDKLQGDRATLQTAQRGTQRLLRLVNLFMEYRKVNTGNLHLHATEGDIVGFVKTVCQDFWPLSQQKAQHLTFTPFARHHDMPFDEEMVETMVYNLLSNAVKYTPEGGTIGVSLSHDGRQVVLVVADSGPGIAPAQRQALFKPFMQGLASQGGMGIGLYTASQMAVAHHGTLSYEQATPQGGSRFTLVLPATADAYTPDELAPAPARMQKDAADSEAEAIVRQMKPEALNDVSIAIIEDDPDMMEQVSSEMGVYFRTRCYANGQKGFEAVSSDVPALLVCDVMLPDMNGYDIVRRLRQQPATRHLPVIMLTALDDETHQIKAYRAGADDYMVKPCNWRLLAARALQLIGWNRHPQPSETTGSTTDSSSGQQPADEATAAPAPLIATQADRLFLDRLAMHVAQHMREETFSMDQLAQLMGMGRTKFYGRVKELTGLSPNKYLMQERMKKAADLLADGELTVAEVSYQVGIQDPSYFNRCFKTHFGVTPSKYSKPAKS